MNTARNTHTAKAPWGNPQMIGFTANPIQGAHQGAYATALNAHEHFVDIQLPVNAPVKKLVRVAHKPARINFVRLAFFGVFMILMLPLFLIIGRSDTP